MWEELLCHTDVIPKKTKILVILVNMHKLVIRFVCQVVWSVVIATVAFNDFMLLIDLSSRTSVIEGINQIYSFHAIFPWRKDLSFKSLVICMFTSFITPTTAAAIHLFHFTPYVIWLSEEVQNQCLLCSIWFLSSLFVIW